MTNEPLRQNGEPVGDRRICPNCLSQGTCFPSRTRGFGESLVHALVPFVRSYRCHACNWRGYVGTFAIVRQQAINLWINTSLFFVLLSAIIFLISYFFFEQADV